MNQTQRIVGQRAMRSQPCWPALDAVGNRLLMQRRRLSTPFQLLRAAIVFAAWVSASVFSSSPSSSDNHDDDLEAVVVGSDVCIGENASSSVCVGEDAESTPSAAEYGSVDGRGDWTIPQKVYRICDPAVAGISAWLVLVIVSV